MEALIILKGSPLGFCLSSEWLPLEESRGAFGTKQMTRNDVSEKKDWVLNPHQLQMKI